MSTKIAIVGSGFGMYCLLPAFRTFKECQVVGICGKNSERMRNYCEKLDVKRYTDWKEMLQIEKPDAVAIAVIPKHQFEIAKYALENKIAVFAEKPLTTDTKSSLELNELAKKNKLANMIDFEFTEIPEWIEAKKEIENGLIGKIIHVNVDWTFLSYDLRNHIKSWKTDVEQGGGALSLVFSHTFYYLENILGRIKDIECKFTSSEKSLNNGDTTIDMKISFENGCTGNAHLDIADTKQHNHSLIFEGDQGTMILKNSSKDLVDNFELAVNNKETQKIKKTNSKIWKEKKIIINNELQDPRVKAIVPIAERFIKWCNSGVAAKPDFQDGLRVQELIELARISNSRLNMNK